MAAMSVTRTRRLPIAHDASRSGRAAASVPHVRSRRGHADRSARPGHDQHAAIACSTSTAPSSAPAQREHRADPPAPPAWSSTIPLEIWRRSEEVIGEALAGVDVGAMSRPAGDHQPARDVVVWDRESGAADAQRDRLAGHAHRGARARARGPAGPDRLRATTGLPLSTYFSGPEDRLDPRRRARRARRAPRPASSRAGRSTVAALAPHRRSRGVHATDVTNASRTTADGPADARLGRAERSR